MSKSAFRPAFRLFAAVSVAALFAVGGEGAKELACRLVPIPESTHSGSGYTALEVGLDGRVYIGTAIYGGYCHLVAYDPRTDRMVDLADFREVTREHRSGINTQGKIHTKLQVDTDGRIWGGTKQGHEIFETRPEYGEDPEGYPGGHLFFYDPATDRVTDLGILKPQEGLMGPALDRKRRKLYMTSCPKGHFLVYDIPTGRVSDKGKIGSYDPRYMVMAADGCAYLPGGDEPGYMVRYDPDADRLSDLPVEVAGPGRYVRPYALAVGPQGRYIYGMGLRDPWLMEFDTASVGSAIRMQVVSRTVPPGYQVKDQHTLVLGRDDCLYYPVEVVEERTDREELHIMRWDPARHRRTDLGAALATNYPDVRLKGIQGSAVAEDGTLYLLCGSEPFGILVFPGLTGPR